MCAPPRPSGPRVLQEDLKGTRVMWQENDLWSTLQASTEATPCATESPRRDVGGVAAAASASPPPLPLAVDSPVRESGSFSGVGENVHGPVGGCETGGVPGLGDERAVNDVDSGGDWAEGDGKQGCDDSVGYVCAPEVDMFAGAMAEVPCMVEAGHGGGERAASQVSSRQSVLIQREAVWGEDCGRDSEDVGGIGDGSVGDESVDESPPAMMSPADAVRLGERDRLEGCMDVRAAGGSGSGLVHGRSAGGGVNVGGPASEATMGRLRSRLSVGDVSGMKVVAGFVGGGTVGSLEDRETVESLGDVIELPMVIDPLPIMHYYEEFHDQDSVQTVR